MKKDEIRKIIYEVIDEINQNLPKKRQLEKKPEEILFGREGKLDSLGLVNMIVAIEDVLEEKHDITITIADEKAMSMKNSPFRSVEALTDYIEKVIREENE